MVHIEKMQSLIVIGGGGYGQLIVETARLCKWEVIGYTDPNPDTARTVDAKYLGADTAVATHPDARLVLGVGSVRAGRVRENIVGAVSGDAARWTKLIHPGAFVSPTATVGSGAVMLAGAVVNSHSRIGLHTIINSFCLIDHDVSVGDYTHVGPGAILGGGASIGSFSMIGIHGGIRDHVKLGAETTVGMGAIVTKSFGDRTTLVGCPAAPI